MDTSSKLFNDHMKLQRDFEYQMDRWVKFSKETRAKREAFRALGDAADKHGVGSQQYAEARQRYHEAVSSWRAAMDAQRKALDARFDRMSREIGGPGLDAWLDILCMAENGVTLREFFASDGP